MAIKIGPYYYGLHKWDDYLIDVQDAVENSNAGIGVALNNLSADLQWGFTLMIDRQEKQIRLLNEIVGQLDAIREVVEFPSATRARELFSLGQKDFQRGFLPEALEKFLAAERENKVNFPLQLQIGKLYLYGKNASDDVIDLPKAEQHLLLAARYADMGTEWAKYRAEAFFHAAIAAYLSGEKAGAAGRADCLKRALSYLHSATDFWPKFAEIYYLGAKCHALLGHRKESLVCLEILAGHDLLGYSAKVNQDRDFDVIRDDAQQVFRPGLTKLEVTRKIMGRNFLGIEEVIKHYGEEFSAQQRVNLVALTKIPFSEATLAECKNTHLLVLGFPISIPGTYTFPTGERKSFDGGPHWYLIRKVPIKEKLFGPKDQVASGSELAYAVILYRRVTRECLLNEDRYARCSTDSVGWGPGGLFVGREGTGDFGLASSRKPDF